MSALHKCIVRIYQWSELGSQMNSQLIQLLVLAGIAVFLIMRLRDVLGTRDGFEQPKAEMSAPEKKRSQFEVIEGGPDLDIVDHVEENSTSAIALAKMKSIETDFTVSDFIQGARGAYEMILMAFENGDMVSVKPFLNEDVYEAFSTVVDHRKAQGLTIEANFIGVRETSVVNATFDDTTKRAEIDIKFIGELTSIVYDKGGDVVEGDANSVKRQKDTWTFAREMGSSDPNWLLVATGE